MTEPQYEVLWPLAEKEPCTQSAAPRIADLSGKIVAELWDAKFHGEVIYPLLREHLRLRYPGIRFIEYSEFGNFYGPKEKEILGALPARLRELGCHAVISGIGA